MDISLRNHGFKGLWLLIDPDFFEVGSDFKWLNDVSDAGFVGILVGGSLQSGLFFDEKLASIRQVTKLPLIIFPGSMRQISINADGILLLNLISGRNAEYLIGQHVQAAMALLESGLKIIPTAYLLIDGGGFTTVNYITQTLPIPANKPDICAVTALAGTQLGLKTVFLDTGSGAKEHVPLEMVRKVRSLVDASIIVGGGVNNFAQYVSLREAGADWVVMGSAFEKDPTLLDVFKRDYENYQKAQTP